MTSKNTTVADGIVDHVEDVNENEDSRVLGARTYVLILVCVSLVTYSNLPNMGLQGINMAYAGQLMAVVGSGSLARSIANATGTNTVWYSSLLTIFTALLAPPTSQAADYWGRKWLVVLFTTLGVIGCIIVSRATYPAETFIGFSMLGLAYGAQPLVSTISSEVLPRRQRTVGQAIYNIVGCLTGVVSLLVGGALTLHDENGGFRTYFYICAGAFALATIICIIFYNPPPRELQLQLTFSDKLRKLDWPAYILLMAGVVPFCIGLSWSNNPYPWYNAHVSAPFAVGIFCLVALGLYARFINKEGMLHCDLFRHRNFVIASGCLFVEGLSFFSVNSYLPTETAILFTKNPIMVGLHFGIAFISATVTLSIGAAYSWKTKTVRPPAVLAYTCFVVFFILMATIDVNSSGKNFWAYPVFVGAGFGISLTTLTTLAQFATPPELISTATGVLLTFRSLGGAIGLAVYNVVFNHGLSKNLSPKVAAAVLPLGLPEKSLGAVVEALTNSNYTAVAKIPGINDKIIAAVALASREAYIIAFRYVWVAAGTFTFVALLGES